MSYRVSKDPSVKYMLHGLNSDTSGEEDMLHGVKRTCLL